MKSMRRILIGVIILIFVSVLVNYLQTWYRRAHAVKTAPQILGSEMKRSAEKVDYSNYRDGILRFKIHAQGLLETKLGKSLLEGIEGYDFNPDGSIHNEIRSRKAEYDSDRKIADFSGDVRLFVSKQIELRTDSLHYDLNSGIGTTPDVMRLFSDQIGGTARGIRFDQKEQTLVLGSEVDLMLTPRSPSRDGQGKPEKLHVTSEKATFFEATNRIVFEGNARLDSELQEISGATIEAVLDPGQKRLRSLTADTNALYRSKNRDEAQTLEGNRLVFGISPSGALEKIDVSGNASFSAISSSDEQVLRGSEIDVDFDAKELPSQIKARTGVSFNTKRGAEQVFISGDQFDAAFVPGSKDLQNIQVRTGTGCANPQCKAKMSIQSADSENSELQADEIRMSFRELNGRSVLEKLRAEGAARYVSVPAKKAGAKPEPARSLSASLVEMYRSKDGDFFESGIASGKVLISEDPNGSAIRPQIKQLLADNARFGFFPGGNRLKDLDADGHVQVLYQKSGSGKSLALEKFRSSSEKMKAVFGAKDGSVESVAQWGNFAYADGSRAASSGRCDYDAVKQVLVLRESPKISDETMSTTGNQVEYDKNAKVLTVHGQVRSILSPQKGQGAFLRTPSSSSSPAIVTADEMSYWSDTGRVRYTGKVQLLSEDQQLRAETLDISEGSGQVDAWGAVRHTIFRSSSPPASPRTEKVKGIAADDGGPTIVRSSGMRYLKEKNAIAYSGKVTLNSKNVDLSSDTLDAELNPEGEIEHITARGGILMRVGTRECKGDIADYYANPEKFVVTGKPAEVYEPGKGRSSARRLTSFTADDRILLEK